MHFADFLWLDCPHNLSVWDQKQKLLTYCSKKSFYRLKESFVVYPKTGHEFNKESKEYHLQKFNVNRNFYNTSLLCHSTLPVKRNKNHLTTMILCNITKYHQRSWQIIFHSSLLIYSAVPLTHRWSASPSSWLVRQRLNLIQFMSFRCSFISQSFCVILLLVILEFRTNLSARQANPKNKSPRANNCRVSTCLRSCSQKDRWSFHPPSTYCMLSQ